MPIFKKLFSQKSQPQPQSPWEQTIEAMRNKDLDGFEGVVEVLCSKDSSRRYVIILGPDGRFRYEYQELTAYTQEEQEFFTQLGEERVAYWTIDCTKDDALGFPTRELALDALHQEKAYKKYF